MSKVVVVIEGGLVQAVHSDDPTIDVAVLDSDVFEDVEPKLDLDNFFRPQLDPELTVLKKWQERKAEFLAEDPEDAGE
jgi:hypothetical protein